MVIRGRIELPSFRFSGRSFRSIGVHVPTEGVASSCSGCLVIERWNGTGWHPQEVRVNPRDSHVLWSAAATSSRDAWAVGNYGQYPDVQRTWIVRWDGTTWTHVPSPNPGGLAINELLAVAATSRVDAWAVGDWHDHGNTCCPGPGHTVIEHWDGTAWTHVPSPDPGGDARDNALSGVAATSPGNAWAVGWSVSQSYTGGTGRSKTLIEHWDGTSWVRVPAPSPGFYAYLSGVAATSPDNAWAVGGSDGGTLIEHWNGTTWTRVPSPSPGPSGDVLYGVAATSPTSAWAVGGSDGGTLIEHWNGTAWTQVPQPVSGFDSSLNSVAAISASDVWAVGEQNLNQTVTEHWNGSSWTLVPSPSVTAGNAQDVLGGVSAIGSSDVWAVGFSSVLGTGQTLAEHWNGTAWQIVASANPGPGSSQLSSLAQTAPGGPLRAVGFATGGTPATATLVETTVG
jgi:hypothetical protein